MAKVYTHPHWETNVIDRSIYVALEREILPLFLPIFFARAQQGPVGVPMWVPTYNKGIEYFGEGTFDESTKYFSREALYMKKLFARQGCFMVRMASADAQYASLVLELSVKRTSVQQYERDAYGQFVLDTEGNKIPMVDANQVPVTEPGVELMWGTRPLVLERKEPSDRVESITSLLPVTVGTGEDAVTTYPMLAIKASDVGASANDLGIKFFADLDEIDDTLCTNVGAMQYTFGAVKKTYGQDTVSAILSAFQNQYETFVAKPEQQDSRVARNISFEDVMGNEYDGVLPWESHIYSENFEIVGKLIQDLELDDETITDPYLVNLAEPYNYEGVPYTHVVMSEAEEAIALNDERILYLQGGSDGSIDDASVEELTRQYLDDLVYPEILDQPRYPFTHIVDTGVSLATKRSFIKFLGKHDAFKVILATQDANLGRFNTKNEDLSSGSALYADCLLQPESIEKGTECCRAEIYQQAGYLADSTYRGIVPATIDVMMKKSRWQSTQSITGQPTGLPNSIVDSFKKWNWTPCDADHKQRSWDLGLNYFQHYDMEGIHYAAMRSVYRYDTSVLSSALFTDVVVYTKHIARYNWSRFSGVEIEFSLLATRASSALSNDLSTMLNGFCKFTVAYTQSEEERKIGYISHATIQLWGNPQQRVTKFDIECYRNGFDPTATEEV